MNHNFLFALYIDAYACNSFSGNTRGFYISDRYKHAHKNAVVACSALKQQYRHILRHGKADIHQQLTDSRVLAFGLQNTVTSSTHDVTESLVTDMVFVYLKGNKKLLASRLQERQGHFFPPLLLDSQIAALEEPTESEHSMLIDIEKSVDEIVRVIMKSFQTSWFINPMVFMSDIF